MVEYSGRNVTITFGNSQIVGNNIEPEVEWHMPFAPLTPPLTIPMAMVGDLCLQAGSEFYLPRQFDSSFELHNWVFEGIDVNAPFKWITCPKCGDHAARHEDGLEYCNGATCTWSNDPELSRRLEVWVDQVERWNIADTG